MEKSEQSITHVEHALPCSGYEDTSQHLDDHHDDSPHNPIDWPLHRKLSTMAVVGLWILLGTTNMTIISPAMTTIAADLHAQVAASTYLTGGPLLAYGVASFFWVPIANRIGTRTVYVFGATAAACFSIWGARATTFASLIAARTLASVMFAPPETLAPQMVGTLWSVKHRATAMTWIGILQATGFSGGPLVGGFVVGDSNLGWRWVQWIMAIVTASTAVILLFFFPETQYVPTSPHLAVQSTSRTFRDNLRFWSVSGGGPSKSSSLLRGFLKLLPMFTHPILLLSVSFFSVILMAQTYLMTTQSLSYPIEYGFSVQQTGLTYIATALGTWVAMLFCGTLADWLYTRGKKHTEALPHPEKRLPLLLITAITGVAGLLVFGISTQNHLPWVVPLVGSFLMSFTFISSLSISFSYLLDIYGNRFDAAMVIFNGIKNVAAFAISYAVVPWNSSSGYTIPFGVLAAAVLAAHGLMIVCYFCGPTLRKWT